MPGRVEWNEARLRELTQTGPARAFVKASSEAAGIGAKKISSNYTGTLARDVSSPKQVGPLHALAGSNQVYAAIENDGGVIRAKSSKRMVIRGQRGRSTTGGPIVASATEVVHKGKHFLEAIVEAFPRLFLDNLRRMR